MKTAIRFFCFFVFVVVVCSCSDYYDTSTNCIDEFGGVLCLATFGEQTGHPLSLEKVKDVYSNLPIETRNSISFDSLTPTHKYVRFIPSSYKEMDFILSQKELDLYQYPLDCEITEGFVGIDNPFMINGFPQYWCVVPYEMDLDDLMCPYEIESELWIPSFLLCPESNGNHSSFEEAMYEGLIKEYENDNQVSLLTKATNGNYPGGYVRYQDSILGNVGIEGMVVEAYTFWNNFKATSNSTGYLDYGGHSFSGTFRYRVKFKREDFAVRKEDVNSDLEYVTNSTTAFFNRLFTGEYAKYCIVFQAAQRFYYQPLSIPRPPENTFWSACLRLCVYPNSASPQGWAGCHQIINQGILADRPVITIWGYGSSGEYPSDFIYGTAIHELAHAMHYNMNTSLFQSIQSRVKESLARGVEIYLSNQRYSSYASVSLFYSVNRYTGMMTDLVDGTKTVYCAKHEDDAFNITIYSPPASYDDRVAYAFTYPELVEAVNGCTTPVSWYSRILSLYPGRISYGDLYSVFNFWFDL